MNGYREWFQDQARDLVMWGLGKAEEASGIPLWNNVVNSASHDIKEYMTEQLETEFLQRHPEAIEYPEVVNMSHEIMYPTEKKTLQEFWTGWENNLERAKENRSWFHDEMAKKPYEAPRWQEPTKAVDAIDFNITRPEVPDKHKAHPLVYGEEYIDTAKPVTIESEDPERINFSAEPRPTPDTPKDVALDKDSIHIVKKGDVLSKIAKKYGVSVNDIMKENDIKHQDRIYPDQEIRIPVAYSKVASKYDMESLKNSNFNEFEIKEWVSKVDDTGKNIGDFKKGLKMSNIVKAVLEIETSGGSDFDAKSKVGAIGLMQIMPNTAKLISKQKSEWTKDKILYDPKTNFLAGLWLLRDNFKRITDSRKLNPEQAFWASIALYNWGWGKSAEYNLKAGNKKDKRFLDLLDRKGKNPESYFNELPKDTRKYFVDINTKLGLGKNFKIGK